MIDTGHLGAPPDNTEKTFDAVPLRTHSLTLASKALASKALASKALPEVQVDLAHVDSIRTRGRLAASVAPEVTQSIAAIVANAQAARHFLDLQPPVLDEVRQALDCIVTDAYRASDVIYRIRGLFKEAPPKKEPVEINGAIRDVLELTRDEVTKNGVLVLTHFAEPSPTVQADRVQLHQLILNLIVRRAPRWLSADGRDAGAHSAFRRRYLTLSNACPKGISNFVRCIRSLGLLGRPSTRGRPGDQKKRTATPMTNDQSDKTFHPSRRGFLGVAAATGAASLAPGVLIGTTATTAALAEASEPASFHAVDASASTIAAKLPSPVPGYLSFGPDEAGFVEVMVNVMCPADALTPGGVDCGLAAYIDRQLAGGFGKGARLYMRGPWREGKPELGYQLPLTPEQFFKAGLAAADAACQKRNGKAFSELDESGADRFLHEIADGKVMDERVQLASWFNELVYPLFEQACFADPIYGGNVGKVFWKAIGYPGLPAVHSQDMIDFRGKQFPGAADPKSIADFA